MPSSKTNDSAALDSAKTANNRRLSYTCLKSGAQDTAARLGKIDTRDGQIETPVFMPVGTLGNVKGVITRDLYELDAPIILGNTYHLWIRPGMEVLRSQGGLRKWMGWDRPLLTDSGGFQVFSLSAIRKITPEGVEFKNHLSGAPLFMSPEKSIEIQEAIASTIMMQLDVCPALPATKETLQDAIDLSTKWGARCLASRQKDSGALFGIAQGGLDAQLRIEHIKELAALSAKDAEGVEHDFDGLALGGFSVGEDPLEMYPVLEKIVPHMPEDRPRYLMGVGTPKDLLNAVHYGLDMFDCVMPTRNARNGTLFSTQGIVRIKRGEYEKDSSPIDPNCECHSCQNFSKSYIRHLLRCGEITGMVLATIHNLHFYVSLMKTVRQHIAAGTFAEFRTECFETWRI